jgi:hypothetical protein
MTFLVQWVLQHPYTDTIESEDVDAPSLDKVVETCKEKLVEVRLRHSDRPPNGFRVLSEDGAILRTWIDKSV